MTDQEQYQLEMYLLGQLSQEEKFAFEARMNTDQELRTAAVQMRATIVAIRQSAIDAKFALLKDESLNQNATSARIIQIRPLYRYIAAAAVVIIMVLLVRPILRNDDTIHNAYLAENFDEFILHDTHKGTPQTSTNPEIHHAYSLYSIQEFHKAIPLLEENWKEDRDTLSLFYLWVSAVGTDDKKIMAKYESDMQSALATNKEYQSRLSKLKRN